MKVFGIDFKEAVEKIKPMIGVVDKVEPKKQHIDKTAMSKLYKASSIIHKSDLAWKYLKSRSLGQCSPHVKLGFCRECYESETKKNHPAMLATFSDPNGNPLNIHRTYLTGEGKKLCIQSPKKFLPSNGTKLTGGACRLFNFKSGTLAVAEGIETAIAISIVHNIPVWATCSANLMEGFEVPEGVDRLEIYGDNDENYVGQKAAYTLAQKVVRERGIHVDVYVPAKRGTDFLDELANEITD